jgi:hypothetical protein
MLRVSHHDRALARHMVSDRHSVACICYGSITRHFRSPPSQSTTSSSPAGFGPYYTREPSSSPASSHHQVMVNLGQSQTFQGNQTTQNPAANLNTGQAPPYAVIDRKAHAPPCPSTPQSQICPVSIASCEPARASCTGSVRLGMCSVRLGMCSVRLEYHRHVRRAGVGGRYTG